MAAEQDQSRLSAAMTSNTRKKRDHLKTTWSGTTGDRTRVVEYLKSRGLSGNVLEAVSDQVVRFHPSLDYWDYDEQDKLVKLGTFPAMVAKVTDGEGAGVTLHRTYLDPDDPGKLELGDSLPAKKLMSPATDGGTRGASIKIFPAGSVLGLTEGIETALAVHTATGQSVWSCVSAQGLETVDIPTEVRAVHVWADNDASEVGQRKAAALAERLTRSGHKVYLHIPPEPGADWLDIFTRSGEDALLQELTNAQEWSPDHTDGLSVGVRLSTVKPEQVFWLWPGRLPLGKVSVLDGDPGLGKSTVALDIAARVSRGFRMPDGTGGGEPAGAVIVSAEDGLADTIVPRLLAAGADLERIIALETCPDDQGGHPFSMPDDLGWLERAIREVDARLIIIDPLMAFLDANTNSHRDQDIRRVLARAHALAEKTGAALSFIRHLNKTSGGPAVYRGGGSIGIIGAARSALLIARDPDDENRRVLAAVKHNLSVPPESLLFRLETTESGVARVTWEGTSSHQADALLAMPSTDDERRAIDDAKDFLLTVLSNGPVASSQVNSEARSAAISDITLRRAKSALGVVSRKEGMTAGWVWALPEGAHESPKMFIPGDRASSAHDEHLREPDPLPRGEVVTI